MILQIVHLFISNNFYVFVTKHTSVRTKAIKGKALILLRTTTLQTSDHMLDELSHDRLTKLSYSKLKDIYLSTSKSQILSTETKVFIEQVKSMEQLLLNSKRFIALFAHDSFTPIYASSNMIRKLGFTQEEFYNLNLLDLIKSFYPKHVSAPYKVCDGVSKFLYKYEHLSAQDNIVNICGIKIKDKKGKIKTIFVKARILKNTDANSTAVSFFEIEDISSIYKGDTYWVRIANKSKYRTYTHCFISNGTRKKYQDLFTPRELEVLALSEQYTSLVDIANALQLSKETVKRHRKNMLARSGMQDIPSLIHVCYLAGIF